MLDFGILGNNARNLHYIKKWNPKKVIRLADNKLQTKKFLGERGIPFAETYATIKNRKQLNNFDFQQLKNSEFVIKPNHGSKGKGILIAKKSNTTTNGTIEQKKDKKSDFFSLLKKKTQNKEQQYFEIQKKQVSEENLKRAMLDILDGKFSLTMTDQVIIEEKLIPSEDFKKFCEFGLADLRIIVFNLVPVAAMIRIPTEKSGGKANLNAGGIGCGIDIGSGRITSMLYKNRIYSSKFPAEFSHYQGKEIPFWNDILFYSAKVQYFVNLGYLALDRVITTKGPKLLEINARAGLEVQKVADIKLKNVLNKLNDMKIQDPEKGVTIAKTLFSKEESLNLQNSKILYLSQHGKIKFLTENSQEDYDITIKVDLTQNKNLISPDLFERSKLLGAKTYLEIPESEILIKNIKYEIGESESTITLGQKTASKFLIKPVNKDTANINILNPKKIIAMETAQLHLIDDKLEKISKRFNLTARLKPINYFNELDRFISQKGDYNPIFEYRFPSLEQQSKRNDELLAFQEQLEKTYLKSKFLNLFKEKAEELTHKAKLLKAYTLQDFKSIEEENIALFDPIDTKLLKISKEKLFEENPTIQEKNKNLNFQDICEHVEKYFIEKGIFGVEVVANSSNFSRMSLSMGKSIKLNIANNLQLSEIELKSLLAHEIDIHLIRYLNGSKSGWKIFKSGTAYYLKDEEGLAVWNAMQKLPEEENLSIYKKYYILAESKKYSFAKIASLIHFLTPEKNLERIFKGALRTKKGLIFTGQTNEYYGRMKDKIYLDGIEKIKKNNIKKEHLGKLTKAKIKIEDQIFIN